MYECGIKKTESLNQIICNVKTIVTFFKQSARAADFLRQNTTLKLKQNVPTRWNSTYDMLKRFLEISDKVNEALFSVQLAGLKPPPMVSGADFDIIQEMVVILKPWADVTAEMSAENNVTALKIIPIIYCLKKTLDEIKPLTVEGRALLSNIKSSFDIRFKNVEENSNLALSTFLDPRFKADNFEKPLALSKTLTRLQQEMSRLSATCEQEVQVFDGFSN